MINLYHDSIDLVMSKIEIISTMILSIPYHSNSVVVLNRRFEMDDREWHYVLFADIRALQKHSRVKEIISNYNSIVIDIIQNSMPAFLDAYDRGENWKPVCNLHRKNVQKQLIKLNRLYKKLKHNGNIRFT